jgi:hypothetical protein
MFQTPARRFFVCGMAIAALEEFITQGVLKGSYFSWVFTLIPFAVFLVIAWYVRIALDRRAAGWRAGLSYYLVTGGLGLAVEWFVIGLSPWSDRTSPPWLIALFHAGVFSFWGTVALAPHLLLDDRPEWARLRRWFLGSFAALMGMTYVLTLTAKVTGAEEGVQFLASIGPLIVTFLTMNVFYALYFRSCGRSAPTRLTAFPAHATCSRVAPTPRPGPSR